MADLYERINIESNQTLLRIARHLNFVNPVQYDSCAKITVMNEEERCEFASTFPACQKYVLIFPYTAIFYCMFDYTDLTRSLGIAFLCAISAFYFWLLASTTDQFFCPTIFELSHLLHINENVAGATILAVGNGAPEIFFSVAGVSMESRHPFTECASSNLFVSAFASGIVIWYRPFSIQPEFFLRDVGFVLFYMILMDFCIKFNDGVIGHGTAFGLASLYIIYIVVVIFDQYLLLRKRRILQQRLEAETDEVKLESSYVAFKRIQSQAVSFEKSQYITYATHFAATNKNLWSQFWSALISFKWETFKRSSHISQLYQLFQIIPMAVLRLIIPQIQFESGEQDWSKLLACLQCTLTPTIVIFGCFGLKGFYRIPIFVVVMITCLPVSIIAFRYSRTDALPTWYRYMIILTVISSIFVLFVAARELMVVMETLGYVMKRSNTFIGCTFFTWGNGIGDLITAVAMARRGFPRMAFAACYGGPLFNFFVSFALPLIYKTMISPTGLIHVTEGTTGETSSVFLIISCYAILLYGLTTNFMLLRTGGLMGMIIYGLFLIMAISHEFQILHPYGTDHAMDANYMELDFGGA